MAKNIKKSDLLQFARDNWEEYTNQLELLNELAIFGGFDYYIEQLTGASDCDYSYWVATMCCKFGILCFKSEIYEQETPADLVKYAVELQKECERIARELLTLNK